MSSPGIRKQRVWCRRGNGKLPSQTSRFWSKTFPWLLLSKAYWYGVSLLPPLTWAVWGFLFGEASLMAQRIKRLPAMQETWVLSLGWEDPLEKEMATHSSILAWRIPWTEEPGGLQSTGLQRVGHDWANSLREVWSATVHGVTKNQTWLSN